MGRESGYVGGGERKVVCEQRLERRREEGGRSLSEGGSWREGEGSSREEGKGRGGKEGEEGYLHSERSWLS